MWQVFWKWRATTLRPCHRGYPHPSTSSTRAWHRSPAPGVAGSPAAPWSAGYRHAPPPRPSSEPRFDLAGSGGVVSWDTTDESWWRIWGWSWKIVIWQHAKISTVHHHFVWDLAKENMSLTINYVDFAKKQLYLNKKNDINQETCGFKHQNLCG